MFNFFRNRNPEEQALVVNENKPSPPSTMGKVVNWTYNFVSTGLSVGGTVFYGLDKLNSIFTNAYNQQYILGAQASVNGTEPTLPAEQFANFSTPAGFDTFFKSLAPAAAMLPIYFGAKYTVKNIYEGNYCKAIVGGGATLIGLGVATMPFALSAANIFFNSSEINSAGENAGFLAGYNYCNIDVQHVQDCAAGNFGTPNSPHQPIISDALAIAMTAIGAVGNAVSGGIAARNENRLTLRK